MPGRLERFRKTMSVKPTPRDKGLTLTIKVTAYDNGMIEVDGVPINESPAYEAGHGWMGGTEMVVSTLNEFRRQVEKRGQRKSSVGGGEQPR